MLIGGLSVGAVQDTSGEGAVGLFVARDVEFGELSETGRVSERPTLPAEVPASSALRTPAFSTSNSNSALSFFPEQFSQQAQQRETNN